MCENSVSKTSENISNEPEVEHKKVGKKGIIYLSTIPPYMNVSRIREVFEQYGTVGRVYLQLADKDPKVGTDGKIKKKKVGKKFSEGWIEFEKKSVAKKVAQLLNNQQVSSRKKSKQYDCIWNIKYLSNFKWTHLHERLAYEKAARRQKLRAEIQLAKKKASFFTLNVDKHKKNKKNKVKTVLHKPVSVPLQENDKTETGVDRGEFLKHLFKKSVK